MVCYHVSSASMLIEALVWGFWFGDTYGLPIPRVMHFSAKYLPKLRAILPFFEEPVSQHHDDISEFTCHPAAIEGRSGPVVADDPVEIVFHLQALSVDHLANL